MDRSRLRRCAGMKLADLDPNLAELAREDRIEVSGEIAEFSDIARPRYS